MNIKAPLLKEKKSTSDQLRLENKKLELRLQQLKLAMIKEKEERLAHGNQCNWSSGTPGALMNYKPNLSGLNVGKKVKLKMLKEEPILPRNNSQKSNILRDISETESASRKTDSNVDLNGLGRSRLSRKCGQCEEIQAAVNCKECAEDYCPKCFAVFHLKGALRKHRSLPISNFNSRISIPSPLFKPPNLTNQCVSVEKKASNNENDKKVGKTSAQIILSHEEPNECSKENEFPKNCVPSLADGIYDEKFSKQYFQEAINAWRNNEDLTVKEQSQQLPLCVSHKLSTNEHSTETTMTNDKEKKLLSDLIQFTPSLTYAEKLLLRKHRENLLATDDMKQLLSHLAKKNDVELLENNRLWESSLALETSLINSTTEKALKNDQYHIDFDKVTHLLNDADMINGQRITMTPQPSAKSFFKVEELQISCPDEKLDPKIEVVQTSTNNQKETCVNNEVESSRISNLKSNLNNHTEASSKSNNIPKRPSSTSNQRTFYDKPLSGRRVSARSHKGGKLTSKPSPLLNILANCSSYLPNIEKNNYNKPSSFKSEGNVDEIKPFNKISYNFYKFTPNSWKPGNAWSSELIVNERDNGCDDNEDEKEKDYFSIDEELDPEIQDELLKLQLLPNEFKNNLEKRNIRNELFSDQKSSSCSDDNENRNIFYNVDVDYFDVETEELESQNHINSLERELTLVSKQNNRLSYFNSQEEIITDSLDISNEIESNNLTDDDKFCFEDSLDFHQKFSKSTNFVYENESDIDNDEMLNKCSSRFDDYNDVHKLN